MTGTISSVPVTGGTPTVLVSDLDRPNGLAVADGIIYIADTFSNRIATVPITGGTPTTLVAGVSSPSGLIVV